MHVIYLYDLEGWALYNIGLMLKDNFHSLGITIELKQADDFAKTPEQCDIILFSFSRLYNQHINYRKYAKELICTVHDPFEISNFTDRYNWSEYPLRPLNLNNFDRIAVTSNEMYKLVSKNYLYNNLFLTPTYPDNSKQLSQTLRRRSDNQMVVFSSTNSHDFNLRQVLSRIKNFNKYIYDQNNQISLKQLLSIPIRRNRKNLKLLKKLDNHLKNKKGILSRIRYENQTVDKTQYIQDMVNSDIYICTSFMEGGPLPVMEAVIAGNAIITSNVGQVEDWVIPGENGFYCQTFNEFVQKIEFYQNNPSELTRHKNNSLKISAKKYFQITAWESFIYGK